MRITRPGEAGCRIRAMGAVASDGEEPADLHWSGTRNEEEARTVGEAAAKTTGWGMTSMTSRKSSEVIGSHAAMTSPPGDYREPGGVMGGRRGRTLNGGQA